MGYTNKKKINVYSSLTDELLESFDYDDYFDDDYIVTGSSFVNYSFNRLLYSLLDKKENFYIKIGYKGE